MPVSLPMKRAARARIPSVVPRGAQKRTALGTSRNNEATSVASRGPSQTTRRAPYSRASAVATSANPCTGQMFSRKKVSRLTTDSTLAVDYRDPKTLRYFLTETGKIVPRRISGVCCPHQKRLSEAIKQARNIALLPFATTP